MHREVWKKLGFWPSKITALGYGIGKLCHVAAVSINIYMPVSCGCCFCRSRGPAICPADSWSWDLGFSDTRIPGGDG